MASFRDLVTGGNDDQAGREKGTKALAKECPFVAEALAGTPESGKGPAVSPGTVSFYMDGAKMKFSIYVKSPEKKYFGIVSDPLNPFGSVNSALLLGDVSLKRHSEQKNGEPTDEQKSLLY